MREWIYSGDVNLENGGVYIDLSTWSDGYCNAVKITDLDSACGFTGACMIEHIVINGTDDSKRIRQAIRSAGKLFGNDKGSLRMQIADAMLSYGFYDPDDSWDNFQSHHIEIVQMEESGPMKFDGWKADKRLYGTDLKVYVESVHLK